MKQHITWDQFIELSYEQVAKLQKLINQKYHLVIDIDDWEKIKNHRYVFEDGTESNIHTSYIGFLDKTTIGKMIEILEEHDIEWYDRIFAVDYDHDIYKTYEGELCDELWEEVKRALV